MIYPEQWPTIGFFCEILWDKPATLNSLGCRKVLAAGLVSSISSHFARRFRGSASGKVDMYKIHVVNLKTLERKEDWDMQIWETTSLCFHEAKMDASNVSKTPLHHLQLQCYSVGMVFRRRFGKLRAAFWAMALPKEGFSYFNTVIPMKPLRITQLLTINNQGFRMIRGIAHVTVFMTCREWTGFSSGSVGGAASCAKWQRSDNQLYFFLPPIY